MRIRDVAKLFAGSCLVYFVMAACSSYSDDTPGPKTPAANDGAPGPSMIDPVPSALADGTKSGTRLKLRYFEGSDGARQFINFYDSELQTPCGTSPLTADGKYRCLPSPGGTILYTDTDCKLPAFLEVGKAEDPQPKVATETKHLNPSTYYGVGALAPTPVKLYASSAIDTGVGGANGCGAHDPTAGNNYYALAAPIAESSFVEMTIKND